MSVYLPFHNISVYFIISLISQSPACVQCPGEGSEGERRREAGLDGPASDFNISAHENTSNDPLPMAKQ